MKGEYVSSYSDGVGTWVRGSFHGHCSENSSCASVPLRESVRNYQEVGAGFVTLTDHDTITDLTDVASAHPELILIPGFEYSTRENVVFAGPGVTPLYGQSLEDALEAASDLLTIVAHPKRWQDREYWTLPMLESLGVWPDGTEVFNGHYGLPSALAKGRWPLYNDFWDEILTAGHRLWGYANDDFHDPEDFGNAWNMVLVEERSAAGVIQSAKAGRCYATTGLLMESFEIEGGQISVVTAENCRGRFIGPGGEELQSTEGTRFTYTPRGEAYVRFEGKGGAGWLFPQPAFLNA